MYNILSLLFDQFNIKLLIPPFFTLLNSLIDKNGLTVTVKYFKQCRLHITRYLCGQPLFINKANVGVDRDG